MIIVYILTLEDLIERVVVYMWTYNSPNFINGNIFCF